MASALYSLSATEQANLLQRGEVTSCDLVQSHLNRIMDVNPGLNAFTEVFYTEALIQAVALDKERRQGQVRGLLHGLPISIKECFDMQGLHTSLGVASKERKRASADAAMVRAVKQAGGVILGRTNVSQLMLFHESRNPVFGQTNNPFNRSRTAGGSSGGEATAIAAGMSPLGLGTDIGGSIRIPAHFTGICGIKLTQNRWSMAGVSGGIPGQETIQSAPGPMARTTNDLKLMLQALDSRFVSTIDPMIPPLSFSDDEVCKGRKLRVGCILEDGLTKTSAAVVRAIQQSMEWLSEQNVEVVPFAIPHGFEPMQDYLAVMSADGGKTVQARIRDGEMDPVLKASLNAVNLPRPVKATLGVLAELGGDDGIRALLTPLGEKSVAQLWKLTKKIRDYRSIFLAAMDAEQVDAILCPAHATVALPHGGAKDFAPAGYFSMLFNLVQLPGGVVPVTRVRDSETVRATASSRLERRAAAVDQDSVGLPVGVQLVTRPWQESLLLKLMGMIEARSLQSPEFPRTPYVS